MCLHGYWASSRHRTPLVWSTNVPAWLLGLKSPQNSTCVLHRCACMASGPQVATELYLCAPQMCLHGYWASSRHRTLLVWSTNVLAWLLSFSVLPGIRDFETIVIFCGSFFAFFANQIINKVIRIYFIYYFYYFYKFTFECSPPSSY